MDFELEEFVLLFTRDTATWNLWRWEARCVFPLLLRKATFDGSIDWRQSISPARAISECIRVPEMVVDSALLDLSDSETIVVEPGRLTISNYPAMRARLLSLLATLQKGHGGPLSDAERSRAYRERRKIGGQSSRSVTNRDASRDAVTIRDDSPPPPLSPSSSSVSPLEPLFLSSSSLSLPPPTPGAREPSHSVETAEEAKQRDGLFADEAIETKPKRGKRGPRLARAESLPEGLAEHFLAELRAACQSLNKLGPRKISEGMLDQLRKLYAECEPTRGEISYVVAVRCAMTRRGEEYGHLTWDSICVPSNFRRWLAASLKPGPRPGPGGGRAEPGPRPTETTVINLRDMARKET